VKSENDYFSLSNVCPHPNTLTPKGTYPKPIPKYSKNPTPIPIPIPIPKYSKKTHAHAQNPYPNTQKN